MCCDIYMKNIHIPREEGVTLLLVKIYNKIGE
jgi:hypothetical protein